MGPNSNPTLDAALSYVGGGLSIIPIRRDGSKAPDGRLLPREMDPDTGRFVATWNTYKGRLPSEEEMRRWYGCSDSPGIAVVGGAVSGGLECIDFDAQADSNYPQWRELVEGERPGLVALLSVVRTPRSPVGYHVRYRCAGAAIPGNTKLAIDPAASPQNRCLIETRGEGGYALAPGCPAECHEAGGLYEHFEGPPLADVQTITAEERETLVRCARSFDRAGPEEKNHARAAGMDLRPGDDFGRRGPDWSEILTGWTVAREIAGKRYWRHPGKTKGWSATTGVCMSREGLELFACFTDNADPFQGASGGRQCTSYSMFAAYALLNHCGDYKAAAKELARQGYGGQTHTG